MSHDNVSAKYFSMQSQRTHILELVFDESVRGQTERGSVLCTYSRSVEVRKTEDSISFLRG